MALPHAKMILIGYLITVFAALHWSACVWRLTPDITESVYSGAYDTNWLRHIGVDDGGTGEKLWNQYAAAIEFSMMSMVISIGERVQPQNPIEHTVALMLMMLCGAIYAYIIGAVCGVVSQIDPATILFNQRMDMFKM